MNDRDRLDQLRGLLDRVGRMPASAERDWTLTEVRARVVDVETGTPPTPMRALPPDELEAEIATGNAIISVLAVILAVDVSVYLKLFGRPEEVA